MNDAPANERDGLKDSFLNQMKEADLAMSLA
jgi:hypothetical protein